MDALLGVCKVRARTWVHMVMLTRGTAGCDATRLVTRFAGRSSAAVGPARCASASTAPQTANAVSVAATARLRLRRSLCALCEGAAPAPPQLASAAASLDQCGPGSCAAAASLCEASGLPRNWDA